MGEYEPLLSAFILSYIAGVMLQILAGAYLTTPANIKINSPVTIWITAVAVGIYVGYQLPLMWSILTALSAMFGALASRQTVIRFMSRYAL